MSTLNWILENKNEIKWHLHTTMTLDYAYEAALYNINKDMAVFYDSGKAKNNEERQFHGCSYAVDPSVMSKIKEKCFEVSCKKSDEKSNVSFQVFHAKLSLICYSSEQEGTRFRLIVYSKNHGFSVDSCADLAMGFDLDLGNKGQVAEQNGKEFQQYLCKIYSSTNREGKKWLEDKGLIISNKASHSFRYITLKALDYPNTENIRIMFGGCDKISLWEKMQSVLNNAQDTQKQEIMYPKLTLTPPVFVKSSFVNDAVGAIKNINLQWWE